ncbi:MAG: MBL fold metallo-hydrolase [Candidatus Moranbacteria bacterium]|nr:MBL fold metallo-hydrolase [Candidatus Moranbacteria bacterium]
MLIKHIGHSCFKVETKPSGAKLGEKITIYFDPFGGDLGLKPPKGEADMVIVSHDHYDHNYLKNLTGDYFLINNPGEYTFKNISVIGLASYHDEQEGKLRGLNTIYILESEKIRLCHLGDLGHIPKKDRIDQIGDVHVLFIPVGGNYTIGPKKAKKIIELIEPRIVVPMHYATEKLNLEGIKKVDEFYQTMNSKPSEITDKLKLSSNNLPEENQIIELNP